MASRGIQESHLEQMADMLHKESNCHPCFTFEPRRVGALLHEKKVIQVCCLTR